MHTLVKSPVAPEHTLIIWLRDQILAAIAWIALAALAIWLMPLLPQLPLNILWPANAVAYGAILARGPRLIVGFAVGSLIWKLMRDIPWDITTIAVASFIAVMMLVPMINKLITHLLKSDQHYRLLRIPLIAASSASLYTLLDVTVFSHGATPSTELIMSLWLAESASVLLFTPLTQRLLDNGPKPAALRPDAGTDGNQPSVRQLMYVWLLPAFALLVGLWGTQNNVPNLAHHSLRLLSLAMPVLAAFLLPSNLARTLNVGFLVIWSWLEYSSFSHLPDGNLRIMLLHIQLPLFTATLVAFLAIESSYSFEEAMQALRLSRLRDGVTGLLNDLGLRRVLDDWPNRQTNPPAIISVHLPDLNDLGVLIGHDQASNVERSLGDVLRQSTQGTASIARVQPGLFAVAPHPDATDHFAMACRIQQDIDTARNQGSLYGGHLNVRTALLDEIAREDQDQLISAMLIACHLQARQEDPAPFRHSGPVNDLLDRHRESLQWVQRIQGFLAGRTNDGRFTLFCQPIVDRRQPDHHVIEILLRWQDEQGEFVPPSVFLPVAEDFGLMPQVDRWVLEAALSTVAKHPAGARLSELAINLSGEGLAYSRVDQEVAQLLARHDWAPDRLCLEITESMVIRDTRQAQENIDGLRSLGCRLAIDDFGTGLATFAYLKQYAFDHIKIDGSFIRGVAESPVDQAIVQATVAVARELGTRVIAEFVENDRQIAYLDHLGVHHLQGFGIAKPRPLLSHLDELQPTTI